MWQYFINLNINNLLYFLIYYILFINKCSYFRLSNSSPFEYMDFNFNLVWD